MDFLPVWTVMIIEKWDPNFRHQGPVFGRMSINWWQNILEIRIQLSTSHDQKFNSQQLWNIVIHRYKGDRTSHGSENDYSKQYFCLHHKTIAILYSLLTLYIVLTSSVTYNTLHQSTALILNVYILVPHQKKSCFYHLGRDL